MTIYKTHYRLLVIHFTVMLAAYKHAYENITLVFRRWSPLTYYLQSIRNLRWSSVATSSSQPVGTWQTQITNVQTCKLMRLVSSVVSRNPYQHTPPVLLLLFTSCFSTKLNSLRSLYCGNTSTVGEFSVILMSFKSAGTQTSPWVPVKKKR
jgi:hypothetical protein